MKILGIIAEYNPFHNGHLYHINKAQELIKPDLTIALISSTFNSRGEISLLNNYEKTSILLKNKIDLVIEMPFILSLQGADLFCYNAVNILNKFGVTDIVSGSENNDLDYIKNLNETAKTKEYNEIIKKYLNEGFSYKVSFNNTLKDLKIKEPNSNDLLNLKYYESILKINKNINLNFIKRLHSNYLEKTQNNSEICSASAIRETKNYRDYVPSLVSDILDKKGLRDHSNLDKFICLKRIEKDDVSKINFVNEGLDNLFLKSTSNTFDEIVQELTSKRYTNSRIRRLLLSILFKITNSDFNNCMNEELIPRVLGFNEKGQIYLNSIKKEILFFTNLKNNISHTYNLELKIIKMLDIIYNTNELAINLKLPKKE